MKTKKKQTLKITKDMTFEELGMFHPELIPVLYEKGMHCAGCHAASFETIEEGAQAHGLDPDKLIEELNSKIKKKK